MSLLLVIFILSGCAGNDNTFLIVNYCERSEKIPHYQQKKCPTLLGYLQNTKLLQKIKNHKIIKGIAASGF